MNPIEKILTTVAVTDAMTSPLEGHSRGHIASHLKDEAPFPDTGTLFRKNMDKWRMPALYSSLTTLFIIMSYYLRQGRPDNAALRKVLEKTGHQEADAILRYAGQAEKEAFIRLKGDSGQRVSSSDHRIIVQAASFPLFIDDFHIRQERLRRWYADITSSVHTIIPAMLVSETIALCSDGFSPLSSFEQALSLLHTFYYDNPGLLFDLGFNPDLFLTLFREIENSMPSLTASASNIGSAEESVISSCQGWYKRPLKRATVPEALPQLFMAVLAGEHDFPALSLSRLGGTPAPVAVLAALFRTLQSVSTDSEIALMDSLVNKHLLREIIEAFGKGSVSQALMQKWLQGEEKLTLQQKSLLDAKTRHTPAPKRRGSTPRTSEDITNVVVESWTKRDQARWKKEERRIRRNTDNDDEAILDL